MCMDVGGYSEGKCAPRDPLLIQSLQKRGPYSELFNDAKVLIVKFVVFSIRITTGHFDGSSLEDTLLSIGFCGHTR